MHEDVRPAPGRRTYSEHANHIRGIASASSGPCRSGPDAPPVTTGPRAGSPARNGLRVLLLAGCAASLLAAVPARAQSVEDLKAQLNLLQRRIEQLEQEQRRAARRDAEQRQTARRSQAQPPVAAAAPGTAPSQQAQGLSRPPTATGPVESQQAQGLAQTTNQAPPQVASALPVQAEQNNDPLAQWRGSFPGSFRVPGTDTSVRLYGFAKLNMSGDFGPRNRSDTTTGSSIPLSHGANGARSEGDFQASGRRSRIGIETRTPFSEAFGEIRTQIEMDFAGQNTDLTTQATSNAYTPRLRQAFAEFGQFQPGGWGTVLVGQSNSLFSEGALLPLQWLNDWTALGIGSIRQAQLRYTHRFTNGFNISAAVENSYSDVTSTTGTSYPDSNGGAGFGMSHVPDFTLQALYQGDWGFAALRGVLREVRISNTGATIASQRYSDSDVGFGIGATGAVNLFDKRLILATSLNYGKGLGRYLDGSSAGYSAVTNYGLSTSQGGGKEIDMVEVMAAMVGAQYKWTDSIRSNVSLHGVRLNYPSYVRYFSGCEGTSATSSAVCDGVNRDIWATAVNLIWSPVKPIDLGIEYTHIERTLQQQDIYGARGGKADRIQASAIVRF